MISVLVSLLEGIGIFALALWVVILIAWAAWLLCVMEIPWLFADGFRWCWARLRGHRGEA